MTCTGRWMNWLKYALQECHVFLIRPQPYDGLDLSFSQNNKVLVAVVSGFCGGDFFLAFCFKPFMYAVGPAVLRKVWLKQQGTMAQELQVEPKMQKRNKSFVLAMVLSGTCSTHGSCLPRSAWAWQATVGCWPNDAHSMCCCAVILTNGWMVHGAKRKQGLSLGIFAIFFVSAPHDMSQFKIKTVSLFALFGFLKWYFL